MSFICPVFNHFGQQQMTTSLFISLKIVTLGTMTNYFAGKTDGTAERCHNCFIVFWWDKFTFFTLQSRPAHLISYKHMRNPRKKNCDILIAYCCPFQCVACRGSWEL